MLNESLSKSDIKKIKSIIKKELKDILKKEMSDFKEKELKKYIKTFIEKDYKEFDDRVEDITKSVMQGFHDLMYKERHIIKNKLKSK